MKYLIVFLISWGLSGLWPPSFAQTMQTTFRLQAVIYPAVGMRFGTQSATFLLSGAGSGGWNGEEIDLGHLLAQTNGHLAYGVYLSSENDGKLIPPKADRSLASVRYEVWESNRHLPVSQYMQRILTLPVDSKPSKISNHFKVKLKSAANLPEQLPVHLKDTLTLSIVSY